MKNNILFTAAQSAKRGYKTPTMKVRQLLTEGCILAGSAAAAPTRAQGNEKYNIGPSLDSNF